jgi:hypothetical protein
MGVGGFAFAEEPAQQPTHDSATDTQQTDPIGSDGQSNRERETEVGEATDPDEIEWHSDYGKAVRLAQAQGRMLLIEFQTTANVAQQKFETEALAEPKLIELLHRYVTVRLPLDVEVTVDGNAISLLNHPAFADLKGQAGLAIIDYAHPETEHYGYVVTALPFTPGKFYRFRPQHLLVALDLPPGTLTQRTMVFAVRIHPEAPASTKGELDPNLAEEAKSHSAYQAQIRVQGHHHWERRFPRLSRLLPHGLRAQEVVAESWPHEGLVDAAVDCVDSWRHSSGHWSAVRSHQPRFGYDMKRGGNGIWYATGLFGNRH